jgi:hypothetical protein
VRGSICDRVFDDTVSESWFALTPPVPEIGSNTTIYTVNPVHPCKKKLNKDKQDAQDSFQEVLSSIDCEGNY